MLTVERKLFQIILKDLNASEENVGNGVIERPTFIMVSNSNSKKLFMTFYIGSSQFERKHEQYKSLIKNLNLLEGQIWHYY